MERELAIPEAAAGEVKGPDQYLDPISLGALIVSAATLAWTMYTDSRDRGGKSDAFALTRSVRVQLEDQGASITPDVERVISVVVEETTKPSE